MIFCGKTWKSIKSNWYLVADCDLNVVIIVDATQSMKVKKKQQTSYFNQEIRKRKQTNLRQMVNEFE